MNTRRTPALAYAIGVVLAGLLTAGPPNARADTITLGVCSGCGVSGPFATVTLTQLATNEVSVSVTAASGFSLKTNGGSDIFFNPTIALTASDVTDVKGTSGTVSSDNPSLNGLTFEVSTNQNVAGLGRFGFDMTGIGKQQVGNVQSVGSFDFTITAPGLTVADLEGTNDEGSSWGAHICDAPGTNCGTLTFFASAPESSAVTQVGIVLLAFIALGAYSRRNALV